MLAYLTPSDVLITSKLINILKGSVEDNTGVPVLDIYDSILYNNGSQPLMVDQCKLFLNSAKYPDICVALEGFLPGYSNATGEITGTGFQLLCSDMYNSDTQNYRGIMNDLWGAV
jgi:hypothetical protein